MAWEKGGELNESDMFNRMHERGGKCRGGEKKRKGMGVSWNPERLENKYP